MLLLILIAVIGILLWNNGNARTRKIIMYTSLGALVIAIVYTGLQLNTSTQNSVVEQSKNVIVKNINDPTPEKQQQHTP
ncbi:hypothetical protein SAMN04488542_1154 [Fontibacillus panacisegetis]|uniref:Uncharacterized protein n=1 Tax=Fontibacillus panacisegetis TaxID=670482 RepID=A0A1G7N388_9BACL|nr:hypothetical protein [Fontibacillus panacisegetis]SDF68401.1 hypothetical protein SAMN04488542_1154 [Fontibacillus panacisegetis]